MNAGGNHDLTKATVERIVRQVLAAIASPRDARLVPAAAASPSGEELVVDRAVVSLRDIEGRLGGVQRLVAPRGAVFTPAARDELRKHGVSVASRLDAARAAQAVHVVLAVADSSYQPAALTSALQAEGMGVERLLQVGLTAVVDELSQQIFKGGKRGLLITTQSAPALCMANRHHGVRAVLGTDSRATSEAMAAVGANLLVIDATGKSLFELRKLVRALMQSTGTCPPRWKDRLG